MGQTHDEITQNLANRCRWQVARRDDRAVAGVYRKQVVDGVYRLEAGPCWMTSSTFSGHRRDGSAGAGPRGGHPPGDGSFRAVSPALME